MDSETLVRAPRGWTVMTGLSTLVGAYAVAVVASGFRLLPVEISTNSFPSPWALRLHIVFAGVALLVGPWQFRPGLRARRPGLHRVLGRTYVASCLVGGTAGGLVALTTTQGPVAGTGFLLLAIAWLVTTAIAVRHALARRFADHRVWMVRSFALAFAGVTLRLYLGVAGSLGIEFEQAYPVAAWLCWVPNLVAVELLRTRGRWR